MVFSARCISFAVRLWTDGAFAISLRLQIYRGLGIEPVLDDDGDLDRVLVGSWSSSLRHLSVSLTDFCLVREHFP
jgi:hypothetical protein